MRTMRVTISKFTILLTASCLVTGCFSLPKPNKEQTQKAPYLMAQYKGQIQSGDTEGAIKTLNEVQGLYTNNEELKGGKGANFLNEAQISALLGHAEFNRGDIAKASEHWQESFQIEKNGLSGEHDAKQKNAKVIDFVVNVLSAMAAGMAAQASGSPYYTYDVIKTEVPKPEMLMVGSPDGTVVRVPVRVEGTPFDKVVKLKNASGTYCTATMVARNVAVSAAHCVSPQGQATSPSNLTLSREGIFKPNSLSVKAYYTHLGKNSSWDGNHKNDWLILVTDTPHDQNEPFPEVANKIPKNILAGNEPVMLAGYSSDLKRGYYLTLHYGCKFKKKQNHAGVFVTNCENAKGSSGSAVMTTTPPYKIVAIHTAMIRNPQDEFYSIETFTPEFTKTLNRVIANGGQ